MMVVGLIIVGAPRTNWPASAFEDPSPPPAGAKRRRCGSFLGGGSVSVSIRGAACPDALARRGEPTDGQAGLAARLVLGPVSVQSVCMCLCPPGE